MPIYEIHRYTGTRLYEGCDTPRLAVSVALIEAPYAIAALDWLRESGLPTGEDDRPTYSVSAPVGGYTDVDQYRIAARSWNAVARWTRPKNPDIPLIDREGLPDLAREDAKSPYRAIIRDWDLPQNHTPTCDDYRTLERDWNGV